MNDQKRDDGGPAMCESYTSEQGLKVRDVFAAIALHGIVSSDYAMTNVVTAAAEQSVKPSAKATAAAYTFADAMLAERAK